MHPRVVLVTDAAFGDEFTVRCLVRAAAALPAGWLCVQLRDKARPLVSRRVFGWHLRAATRRCGATLVINGDPWLARDVGADGVHLGGDARARGVDVDKVRAVCGAGAWVSMAAHTDEDVRDAVSQAADAVLVSPIFSTHSARPAEPAKEGRGLAALRRARDLAGGSAAVFALGGVNMDNVEACLASGAHGVAVIGALLACAEPDRIARGFHDAVSRRC